MELPFLTLEEYLKFDKTKKICAYCGIPKGKIKDIYPKIKVKNITIDRMDVSKGYEKNNICWACMPCNMIKSVFLTHTEMKEVGERYMKPKWQK